jgi:DNA (cytosine-5)-methyltransferase 1
LLIQDRIPPKIGDPLSIERYYEKGEISGCMGTRHTKEVKARYAALEYGEQDKISKSVRLHPEKFCPTLRAGTGSDKGSYQAVRPIHYRAPRVITPREAARLQGFPDWFALHRTKWHSFRQIGNSVSPIVSEQLMKVILKCLN